MHLDEILGGSPRDSQQPVVEGPIGGHQRPVEGAADRMHGIREGWWPSDTGGRGCG